MKTMLTIKVEVSPGSDITSAFKEATGLANKLHCFVSFSFNGVKCIANPGGNPEKGAAMYTNSLTSDDDYKFAMS